MVGVWAILLVDEIGNWDGQDHYSGWTPPIQWTIAMLGIALASVFCRYVWRGAACAALVLSWIGLAAPAGAGPTPVCPNGELWSPVDNQCVLPVPDLPPEPPSLLCLFLDPEQCSPVIMVSQRTPAEYAVHKAETLVGTDYGGTYGCESVVAYAWGVDQAKYGYDGAAADLYADLYYQGKVHADMNAPKGALVFSFGWDGAHIDLSRGDGTYVSGGVQGLLPGYGDGHDVQILPTPNVGPSWQYRGWADPWRS